MAEGDVALNKIRKKTDCCCQKTEEVEMVRVNWKSEQWTCTIEVLMTPDVIAVARSEFGEKRPWGDDELKGDVTMPFAAKSFGTDTQ